MKQLIRTNAFKRDFKKCLKRGKDSKGLEAILHLLVQGEDLPRRHVPHKLSGQYQGLWECHIEPDFLLIYDVGEDFVELYRLGRHTDLFK